LGYNFNEKVDHVSVDGVNLKKGDLFTLKCGHKGRVIWINSDEKFFCVQGTSRSCSACGKKVSGGWVPFVHIISTDEEEKE
jgi:hypothetical protein